MVNDIKEEIYVLLLEDLYGHSLCYILWLLPD